MPATGVCIGDINECPCTIKSGDWSKNGELLCAIGMWRDLSSVVCETGCTGSETDGFLEFVIDGDWDGRLD
jgi:hypothetical protein